MIHVTVHNDGSGHVYLPGGARPITATTARAARDVAIRVLTEHAANVGARIEVGVQDGGERMMLTVDPDGTVTIQKKAMIPPALVEPAPAPPAQPAETTLPPLPPGPAVPDALEQTVALNRRTATLVFTGGYQITIRERTLLGRRPAPTAETPNVIAVPDLDLSTSKTHCVLDWDGDQLTITDLSSTNGTSIERGGIESPAEPGISLPLVDGDTVYLGENFFQLHLGVDAVARGNPS